MAAHSVELKDSDSIAASLLSSRAPWTEAQWREFREQGERVQLMLREAGVTEEELLEDFKQLHNSERNLQR